MAGRLDGTFADNSIPHHEASALPSHSASVSRISMADVKRQTATVPGFTDSGGLYGPTRLCTIE